MISFLRRTAARTWHGWVAALPVHIALSAAAMVAMMMALSGMNPPDQTMSTLPFGAIIVSLWVWMTSWVLGGMSVRTGFSWRSARAHWDGLLGRAGFLLLLTLVMAGWITARAPAGGKPVLDTATALVIGLMAASFFVALNSARKIGNPRRALGTVEPGWAGLARGTARTLWGDVKETWKSLRYVWARLPASLLALVAGLMVASVTFSVLGVLMRPIVAMVPDLGWVAFLMALPAFALCPTAAAAVFADEPGQQDAAKSETPLEKSGP